MKITRPDSLHRLVTLAAVVALAHFLVILVHLWLVVRIQPDFPRGAAPGLILVNLVPVVGVITLAKRYSKLAAILIATPLAIGSVIGSYAHFLSPGTDNVLHMVSGGLTPLFQTSAALLVLLEALGCWIGLRAWMYARQQCA